MTAPPSLPAQGTPPGPPTPTMKSLNDIDARVVQVGKKRIPSDAMRCVRDGSVRGFSNGVFVPRAPPSCSRNESMADPVPFVVVHENEPKVEGVPLAGTKPSSREESLERKASRLNARPLLPALAADEERQ